MDINFDMYQVFMKIINHGTCCYKVCFLGTILSPLPRKLFKFNLFGKIKYLNFKEVCTRLLNVYVRWVLLQAWFHVMTTGLCAHVPVADIVTWFGYWDRDFAIPPELFIK